MNQRALPSIFCLPVQITNRRLESGYSYASAHIRMVFTYVGPITRKNPLDFSGEHNQIGCSQALHTSALKGGVSGLINQTLYLNPDDFAGNMVSLGRLQQRSTYMPMHHGTKLMLQYCTFSIFPTRFYLHQIWMKESRRKHHETQ